MSIADDILYHYGVKHRSGRYPWGSGDNPYQHDGRYPGGDKVYETSYDWLQRVYELQREGKKDSESAEHFGVGTVDFRGFRSIAIRERRLEEGAQIKKMMDAGMSASEIGRVLGINESSVRSKYKWYENEEKLDTSTARTTADYLKEAIDKLGGPVDVGEGVERKLGISQERLNQALLLMENEGYSVKVGMMDRATDPTSNKKIIMKVVGKGNLPDRYVRNNLSEIHSLNEMNTRLTEDGTKVRPSFSFPESMDINRLKIVYAEEEGIDKGVKGVDKDGLIEVRRGVQDLDLGEKNYAQVRILVDGDRYLKGMAVYRDPADMPDGVDVIFNTNKHVGKAARDVLKPVKQDDDGNIDKDNPFGSLIKEDGGQTYFDDPNGKYEDPVTGHKQSMNLINKTREEGDWGEWSDKVPAQFLSKQPKKLVESQLNYSIKERKEEYAEIMAITNPTVKKNLLIKFADSCDTGASSLKAAAFPGQKYQVILPLGTIKDNEVYAPNYPDGTQVALVRYPHGGTFEIPILTVNNKNPEGRKVLGTNPNDAIGINTRVAGRLSGADFDGDTVQVIPMNDKVNIRSTPPLNYPDKDHLLSEFDAKLVYGTNDGTKEGVRYMRREEKDPKTGRKKVIDNTQQEMGKITNLIQDMTILGAGSEDLAKAVAHSMVVIDAAKHKLDYRRSEIDNDIKALKKKWQGVRDPETGRMKTPAATIVSRAGAEASEPRTIGQGWIDKETGDMVYKIDTRPNAKGKQRMQQTTQMATVEDAFELVHDMNNPIEVAYAEYANALKGMAREARKEYTRTQEAKRSPSAAQLYAQEVKDLKEKLERSKSNQDIERWAQLIANQKVEARVDSDPSLADDNARLKKLRQQYLTRAREETGAKRIKIEITPREWEAIQNAAVGHTTLSSILKYADPDEIKKYALPFDTNELSATKIQTIKSMASSSFTTEQIANRLGVSVSTVNKYLKGKE